MLEDTKSLGAALSDDNSQVYVEALVLTVCYTMYLEKH